MKTTFKRPIDCYNSIREIEDDMELSIHDLVWKYGKRKETKKYGVTYELSTYDHKRYALVCGCKGVHREIKKSHHKKSRAMSENGSSLDG